MICKRCHKDFPVEEALFCPWCGASQQPKRTGHKARGNGQGTAYKRGKTWTARVVLGYRIVNGKPSAICRYKSGFKTKTEALAFCPQLMAMGERPQRITFAQLYAEWEAAYTPRIKPGTMVGYQAAYLHFSDIHNRQFDSIMPADLQACLDACPRGRRTKEVMKSLASLLYKHAMHNEIVDKNRAQTLYTGNEAKLAREPFTFEEVDRLWQVLDTEPYAGYVLFLCYTGFRPGELLALRKSSYDPATGCLVGGGKTKAGTDRPVPVSPKIRPILERQLALDSEYLFPRLKDMQRLTDDYFRDACFNPLMDRMGITNRLPYSCRHTFANLLKQVTGSDTDKAALMGHANAIMTKYYQEADLSSLRKIVESI